MLSHLRRNVSGRVPAVLIGVVLAVALGLSACTSGGAAAGQGAPPEDKRAATVTMQPAAGATDVSPSEPIKVSVADGTIESVTLTNPDGKQVAGSPSPDRTSWTVAEPLGYAKTYTWNGRAVGTNGEAAPITGSFTTVKPKRQVRAQINTGDGQTYGVAMPIAVSFDAPVRDKAAVQRAMTVQTSVPTEGAWAWLDDRSAHWRPKSYWQPGTQVMVTAKLYGVPLGNGGYGRKDLTSAFSIGRSQIVKADTRTHRWVVIRDGVQVADYPASFGLDTDPGRITTSGTHVVMSKHQTYFMSNPRYDYENFEVQWAVRLSNNGVFAHAAPWSVGDQGKRNVSHGCANLSPDNARAYYDGALAGDPVEITGTANGLSAKDGDYHDWTIPWDEWLAKSAVTN